MNLALSPSDLAQRIAALDWSGTSLQHQLAVTAAVETLRKTLPAAVENVREAWSGFQMVREAVETLGPVGALPASEHLAGPTFMHEAEALVAGIAKMQPVTDISNVLVLPVRQRTCWTTICHLDGRPWSTSSHFGPGGAWNWIVESVAREHSCSEDAVGCIESDAEGPYDGDDIVTIDGLPVYRIQHLAK